MIKKQEVKKQGCSKFDVLGKANNMKIIRAKFRAIDVVMMRPMIMVMIMAMIMAKIICHDHGHGKFTAFCFCVQEQKRNSHMCVYVHTYARTYVPTYVCTTSRR